MLDKQLCEQLGVDKLSVILVDLLDKIDDELEVEQDVEKRHKLLLKKEIVSKIRNDYNELLEKERI